MFTMSFEFERGEEDSVALLNAALASMRLSKVEINDEDGYMFTREFYGKDGQVTAVERGYGFDSITLACEQEEGEDLHRWQFEVEILPEDETIDGSVYCDRWDAAHPDSILRVMRKIGYDTADAFIVLYHEGKA